MKEIIISNATDGTTVSAMGISLAKTTATKNGNDLDNSKNTEMNLLTDSDFVWNTSNMPPVYSTAKNV